MTLCICVYDTCRYSTPEQGFPLCYEHSRMGVAACSNLSIVETLMYPMAMYLVWQASYVVLVSMYLSGTGTMYTDAGYFYCTGPMY